MAEAAPPPPSDDAPHPDAAGLARLAWLIRLRWLALAGVSAAAAIAASGVVPGVNVSVVALAVLLGVLTNVWLWWRGRRRGATDERHLRQALLDTGALTLVVWAAGGAECPFISFYIFPMLLAALLGGQAALLPTGVATVAGLGFQVAAVHVPWLRAGRWDPPSAWADVLQVTATTITVGMAAYFAIRFTSVLRGQIAARREADALLRLAVDGLQAGIEIVEDGQVRWQNPRAERLCGPRVGAPWICPGRRDDTCAQRAGACPVGQEPGRQCAFVAAHFGEPVARATAAPAPVYELIMLPLPGSPRALALYVDRTREILDQQRLLLTERLASLGRTVQGVAHELNTPLATIQTLGRDLGEALRDAELPAELRADVEESSAMIVDEVQRCRRITHALLGRTERLDIAGDLAPLSTILDRAVVLVFAQDEGRVRRDLGGLETLPLPFDPLVQILVNLLQNARDAAAEGPIEVRAASADGRLRLSVRDHGPGLVPGTEEHLFEPFFTTKPPGRGTGLGLYTSYALATELGGELSLSTHPAGGALAELKLKR